MKPDVIDLISSSPPGPSSPNTQMPSPAQIDKRPRRAEPRQRSGVTRSRHGTASSASNSWISDDFELSNEFHFPQVGTRPPKRQRFSISPRRKDANASRPCFQPPVRPFQPPSRACALQNSGRLEIEPIEFTSSLDIDASGNQDRSVPDTSATNARHARPSGAPINTRQRSDPLASSPPPPVQIAPKPIPNAIIDGFSDPFASSPPAQVDPSKCLQDLSDPFVSSPVTMLAIPRRTERPNRERVSSEAAAVNHQIHQSLKDWDPISSSAPEQSSRDSPCHLLLLPSRASGPEVIDVDSESDPQEGSDEEFPDISEFDASKFKPRRQSILRRSQRDNVSTNVSKRNAAPKKPAGQSNRERGAGLVAKAAEKERRRQEKEHAKELRLQEKHHAAALAEVNKVRTDKKVSTPEMIVVMPSSLDSGLRIQIETLLDGLAVQHGSWDSPVGNAFKWRRKVSSRFDEELGRWEPMPLRVDSESIALIILTAQEVLDLALGEELDSSIERAKEHFPGHQTLYIIQGMNTWMRNNRNIRNRHFAAVVRQGADAAASQSRRRNRPVEEYVSEDVVDDAMLRLQVEHDVLIHHTDGTLETAQWVANFTQHISTIPYKKQRDEATSAAGFCMESGQVRTGDNAHDTYIRMLQEIARVTAPVAHGIAGEFETVSKLVNGLESGGPLRLEEVRKSANKDGVSSDRTIGQAVSKRIYKVFTSQEERSRDV